MQLIYLTHHSILDLHAFSPVVSWWLVVGAAYGTFRLLRDVVAVFLARPRNPRNLRDQSEGP